MHLSQILETHVIVYLAEASDVNSGLFRDVFAWWFQIPWFMPYTIVLFSLARAPFLHCGIQMYLRARGSTVGFCDASDTELLNHLNTGWIL